jgi:hypothetical protein
VAGSHGQQMAGLGIRVYTDEMISPALAVQLRQRGYDALSCDEASLSGQSIPDQDQLAFATQNDRALLSFNMRDFVRLDQEWKRLEQEHAGIIIAPEIDDIGSLLRLVERHLETYSPEEQRNLLLWLDTNPAPPVTEAQ